MRRSYEFTGSYGKIDGRGDGRVGSGGTVPSSLPDPGESLEAQSMGQDIRLGREEDERSYGEKAGGA